MVKSRRSSPVNSHIWAQASEWLLRFSEEDVDVAGREQFNDWLRSSPENVRAYLQVSAYWQEAGRIDGQQQGQCDIDALVARALLESNVFPLALGQPSAVDCAKATIQSKRFHWAIAASLTLALGAGIAAWYGQFRDPVYSTGIGEQRTVNLSDGSIVTLNADSRVKVRYSDAERAIELSEGQALFKVAKNAARPFVVRSGGTNVTAVGTQFDVNKRFTGTVVTVVEGRVAVTPLATAPTSVASPDSGDVLLSAGEQLFVAANVARTEFSAHIRPVKPAVVTAWTEGLLVFEAAPITEVVHEFNLHNAKPLVLEGAQIEAVQISGTFPASGSERITRFLQERHGVVIRETDDEIRISMP